MLVVVLGPDGAGKTTLLHSVAKASPGWTTVSANPEHLYPVPEADWYDWLSHTHPRSFFHKMCPLERSAFLATTLAVEYERYVKPALEAGRVVLCDSYWYRFYAKERLQNPAGIDVIAGVARALPVPDLVLWLNLAYDEAWVRKGASATPFEVTAGVISRESFIEFQAAVHGHLKKLVAQIPQIVINASMREDEVCMAVCEEVEVFLGLKSP